MEKKNSPITNQIEEDIVMRQDKPGYNDGLENFSLKQKFKLDQNIQEKFKNKPEKGTENFISTDENNQDIVS